MWWGSVRIVLSVLAVCETECLGSDGFLHFIPSSLGRYWSSYVDAVHLALRWDESFVAVVNGVSIRIRVQVI